MNKMDKEVFVVPRKALFAERRCQGFVSVDDYDYRPLIMKSYVYKRRGDMEQNPEYKQVIPYLLIANRKFRTFYLYRRASNVKDYSEKRLYGKYSIGTGGHIDREDEGDNPLMTNLRREMAEEIIFDSANEPGIRCIGFINDDADPVGKVHFGVVYMVDTDSVLVSRNESEANVGGMVSREQFEEIKNSPDAVFETWSEFCLPALLKMLE